MATDVTLNDLQQTVDQIETHERAIEKIRGAPLASAAPVDFSRIVETAVHKGLPAEELGKLLAVYERMQAKAAESAYHRAISEFHAICPPIIRSSENPQFQVTRNGVKRNATYAALQDIAATIREPLARVGLSYAWSNTVIEGDHLTLACIVSHEQGHQTSHPVTFPLESRAGASPQQKCGATMTYAMRYSLVTALGLTGIEDDVDGAAAKQVDLTPITAEQAAKIEELICQTKADIPAFLEFFGIAVNAEEVKAWRENRVNELLGNVAKLPASRLDEAMRLLERKRKDQK